MFELNFDHPADASKHKAAVLQKIIASIFLTA